MANLLLNRRFGRLIPMLTQGPLRSGSVLCGLFLTIVLGAIPATGQVEEGYTNRRLTPPRGTLNQAVDDPIFLAGYGQMGGGFAFDQGQFGYGGALVFRPGKAAQFLDFMYDWRASLVLQADYQNVSDSNRIFSGDLILRHYTQALETLDKGASRFIGVGFGGSEVELPPGAETRFQKGWSLVFELGQEWTLQYRYLVFVKGQYRRYKHSGYDFSTWSFQAGAGIALP